MSDPLGNIDAYNWCGAWKRASHPPNQEGVVSDCKPGPEPSWDDLWNECSRLRIALATENNLIDQFKADYERSVLNGDRLFDEVERLRIALAETRGVIEKIAACGDAGWCEDYGDTAVEYARAFLDRTKAERSGE